MEKPQKVLEVVQNLLGEEFGRVLSVCKGGSWLYTPEGRFKICVPRFVSRGNGRKLERFVSDELLEEEVLFAETDRGIILKEGRGYLFFEKGDYKLIWKR